MRIMPPAQSERLMSEETKHDLDRKGSINREHKQHQIDKHGGCNDL
jgi:hypothetical protein